MFILIVAWAVQWFLIAYVGASRISGYGWLLVGLTNASLVVVVVVHALRSPSSAAAAHKFDGSQTLALAGMILAALGGWFGSIPMVVAGILLVPISFRFAYRLNA